MSVGGSPLSPPADSHVRTAAAGNGKSADCFGRLLEDRGDLAEAETFYRQAADHGPAWAMVNHGCLLAEQGQMAEAEQLWRQAAAVGDENIRVTAMQQLAKWNGDHAGGVDFGSVDGGNEGFAFRGVSDIRIRSCATGAEFASSLVAGLRGYERNGGGLTPRCGARHRGRLDAAQRCTT